MEYPSRSASRTHFPAMRTTLLILVLLTLVLTPFAPHIAGAPAAPAAPTFADVKEWWGEYTIEIVLDQKASASENGASITFQLNCRRLCVGKFHLDHKDKGTLVLSSVASPVPPAPNKSYLWSGNSDDKKGNPDPILTGMDTLNYTDSVKQNGEMRPTHGGGIKTWDNAMASKQPNAPAIILAIDEKAGTYGVILPFLNFQNLYFRANGGIGAPVLGTESSWGVDDLDGTYSEQSGTCGALLDLEHGPTTFTGGIQGLIGDRKLPEKVSDLHGQMIYDLPARKVAGQGFKDIPAPTAHMILTWHLSPKPPVEEELVISPEDEGVYSDWRPMAALDQTSPGEHVGVKAKLQMKGGGTAEEKAVRITFTLEQVSHEEGICINYPLEDKKADQPDMQFVQSDIGDGGAHVVNDHEAVCSAPDGNGTVERKVRVSSFDYGGFCVVEAKAELESGRIIRGHLASNPDIDSLRLPKSRIDSHIADGWRKQNDAQGADNSDDDDKPRGNAYKGDGFTLYEEYRGFITEGNWSSMDPKVKDFFVINKIGDLPKPGLTLLHDVSGLIVHEIKEGYAADSRVINCNVSAGRHSVDQHGVILQMGIDSRTSRAVGGPSVPRKIVAVNMCSDFATDGMPAEDVAHELLHCCCVWHHGEHDPGNTPWYVETDSDGHYHLSVAGLSIAGEVIWRTPIKLFSERNPDVELATLPAALTGSNPVMAYVAIPHAAHSGDEDCVMRYDLAEVYPKGPPNEYVWVGDDKGSGTALCDTVWGHTFNAATWLPHSRFYDADSESLRGFCQKQICVNDKATPKDRTWKKREATPK